MEFNYIQSLLTKSEMLKANPIFFDYFFSCSVIKEKIISKKNEKALSDKLLPACQTKP